MLNIKAIQLLKTFTDDDIKSVKKFILSDFFNQRKTIADLLLYVVKFHPNYDDHKLSYDKIHKHIFPNEKINQDAIIKLFSILFQKLSQFIVHKQLLENENHEYLTLLEYYNRNNLTVFFDKLIEEKSNYTDHTNTILSYQNTYNIESIIYEHKAMNDSRRDDINLDQVDLALDKFYFYTKLVHICQKTNRSKLINVSFTTNYQIVEIIEQSNFYNDIIIKAWYIAYLLLTEKNAQDNYKELLEIIESNYNQFALDDIRTFYTYIENSLDSIYTNKQDYYVALFDIYTKKLKNGLLYYEGNIQSAMIRNIVTVGIRLKQFEWVRNFIQEHENNILPLAQSKEINTYCLAELEFSEKNYSKVLDLLSNLILKDIFLNLNSKRLYLKLYFELNEFILLENHINSLRVFLHRENISNEDRIEKEKNFITLIKKIVKLIKEVDGYDAEDIVKLKVEIANTNCMDKVWLEEKVNELK